MFQIMLRVVLEFFFLHYKMTLPPHPVIVVSYIGGYFNVNPQLCIYGQTL